MSIIILTHVKLTEHHPETQLQQRQAPICDRCHNLIHHSVSSTTPILHPSIESIQSIIEDSPHKSNHIYHIIDAADFPMSLIPNLTSTLHLSKLRTQNRRSKTQNFARGRVAEVSFIITRSDLLAPQKEQVDGLMPYLRETLRDALGRHGEKIRLGNVRCVSSKRGWWTKRVKEEVWDRGGAGWMVGKVNVGKSGFFETVFPKGRGAEPPSLHNLRQAEGGASSRVIEDSKELEDLKEQEEEPLQSLGDELADLPGDIDAPVEETMATAETTATSTAATDNPFASTDEQSSQPAVEEEDDDDMALFDTSLLPPPQPSTLYPQMPTISSLPGTTASPIRIPFGTNRGELIDLPGIERSTLDTHVLPEHRNDLVMKTRVTPDQYTIKPGQSLLLGGGLVRITPKTETVVLAYPFVPLLPHVTATLKAEAMEKGERESGIASIVAPGVFGSVNHDINTDATETVIENSAEATPGKMKSAGVFKLKWDITRKRAGPLTSPSAAKLSPEKLAFKIWGADVLVEGVGWVELAVQARKSGRGRKTPYPSSNSDSTAKESGNKDDTMASFTPFPSEISDSADLAEEATQTPPAPVTSTTTETKESELEPESTVSTFKPFGQQEQEDEMPEIEVFTPDGKFIAIRPPMNAWLLGGKKAASANSRKSRPRVSMKSLKGSQSGRGREY